MRMAWYLHEQFTVLAYKKEKSKKLPIIKGQVLGQPPAELELS